MAKQTIQNLKGFRDILPQEKRARDFVAEKMRSVFERYAFEPLETPTLEYASLLLGKYGDEADKLVYTFEDRGGRRVGLRYDQTVPTARVLSQYQNQLPKFFRRYQIQNVFRADKPQKARYREFTQCDCDIFGSPAGIADAEILAVFAAVYLELGFRSLVIEVNDRQTLLDTLSPFATEKVNVMSLVQSVDKLDKFSAKDVKAELIRKGLDNSAAEAVIEEIEKAAPSDKLLNIVNKSYSLGVPQGAIKFNPKLARGLDYYTGLIFEGKIPEFSGGSIGGGGRYDNLLQDLAGVQVPAVGFGIGFDRTVEAAQKLGLLPEQAAAAEVLVAFFDENLTEATLKLADKLRLTGIAAEVYPQADKLGKQFKLADQKKIPFVAVLGSDEAAKGTVAIKDMATGEQAEMELQQAIELIMTNPDLRQV